MKKGWVQALGLFFIAAGSLLACEAKVPPVAFTLANWGGGVPGSGSLRMSFRPAGTSAPAPVYGGLGGSSYIEDNYNTAIGLNALRFNTTGSGNTALGQEALWSNTGGMANTASGLMALWNNATGNENTAVGVQALYSNSTGDKNTASGGYALWKSTGSYNTANGYNALTSNETSTGSYNTALGYNAGGGTQAGNYNIFVGANCAGSGDDTNTIRIGYYYQPANNPPIGQNRTFIAGIVETPLSANDWPAIVGVTPAGRLGTVPLELLPTKGDPGPQGQPGPQGPAGEGLISGSLLFLIPGSTVPQGYTLKGSTFFNLTLQNKKTTKLTVNVYQKD
jgi:hypothetical protein